jgi:hypothetical protein
MALLNRLERRLGRFAIPHLSLYLVIGQVLFWSVWFLGYFDLERIALLPGQVLAGEAWRLVTFLFLPPITHPVFIAFAWYMFWLMGSALEGYWGEFRFNVFVLVGWLLTVAVAFLTPGQYASNLFLAGSVFLAFAVLNPDFELMIFFILPVKIKWLALLQGAFYAYQLVVGSWSTRLAVLASLGNFLLFFGRELFGRAAAGRRRMEQQARAATLRQEEDQPRHRCHVCGKTDLTHPREDFRYCSKCAGEECYCSEHLRNHVHTTTPPAG